MKSNCLKEEGEKWVYSNLSVLENINDLNGEIPLLKGGDMSIDFIPAMGWEK